MPSLPHRGNAYPFSEPTVASETSGIDRQIDRAITERELADRWGRSRKSLSNQRSLGIGCPYVKLGRTVRYLMSDVLAFEAAGRVQSGKTST